MKNALLTRTDLAQQLAAARRRLAELERTKESLRQSEEKFRNLFEHARDAVFLADADTGILVDVNPAGCAMLGLPKDRIIGRHMTLLHPPEMAEKFQQVFREHVERGVVQSEDTIIQRADGTRILAEVSASVVKLGDKTVIQGVFRDITKRKEAEEALQESEAKFRNLAEQSPNMIFINKRGRIVYANKQCEDVMGYTREEFYSPDFNFLKLIALKDRDIVSENFKKHPENIENPSYEYSLVTKDGREIDCTLNSKLIDYEGSPAILGTVADITERRQRELALQESEEKFSKAFNFSANAICITSIKDERIIDINESFARFTGYSREEIIGRTGEELNLWVDDEQQKRLLESMSKGDYFVNQEFRSRMKSGEIRTGLVSDEVISIGGEPCRIGVITDITESKKAETALQDEATRRRILVDQSRDGIVILYQEGHVYEANQRFADMLGYSTEEVRHLSVFDWEYSYPRDTVIEMLRTVDESGDHFETSHRRKDGSIYDVEISTNAAIFAGQKLIFCVCRDITKRKQSEERLQYTLADLEKSRARLEAANKELEAFSYSVSHDLRSPLRSIDGFSQALLEDYTDKLDETGRDYLGRLRGASQKMGELIDGLLKLSRLSRSEMHREEVDLSALSQEIVSRLRETEPEREAEVSISPGLTACGDPQLLRALLENLLGNAWKFTGKVPRARIEFGALRNGEHQTFFVRDNGAGFDMSYADKLFGAFQRLHDVSDFPGTGIGLATVRRIVNHHGGTIRAEGKVGKGAVFYFTLE